MLYENVMDNIRTVVENIIQTETNDAEHKLKELWITVTALKAIRKETLSIINEIEDYAGELLLKNSKG